MSEPLLSIRNLRASVDDKEVLKGIDLSVAAGEVAAIMGPNGSGKSTLSNVLAGRDGYEVTDGEVRYDGQDLPAMEPEERAATGVVMAFQCPVEIQGVVNATFTRTARNAQGKARGEAGIGAIEFLKRARATLGRLEMDEDFLRRDVNAGFSGGEKKRNEIFQMAMLEPRLAILDETDSGLDIDALRIVATGVNAMRNPERTLVVITHYQRLLEYVVPDSVHVLADGRIARSGDRERALDLGRAGYAAFQPA